MAIPTAADIDAVVVELLKFVRELDIQGFTNPDNPTYTQRRYDISAYTKSTSPTYTTVITMASAAIAALFQVNEVIKFWDIVNTTLGDELADTAISNEQRKIQEISGADLILHLDSSDFTGTFTSGRISTTYNMSKLEDVAKMAIVDFEIDSGIRFQNDSAHHMTCVKDLVYMNWGKVAAAQKMLIQARYDRRIEFMKEAKGEFYSSHDVDISDFEDDSDFSSDEFKEDLGFGTSTTSLTD